MREDQVIDEVNRLVREVMGDDPVHGYPHVLRVLGYCLKLASTTPGINMFVLKLAALLHDVGRFRSGRHHAIESAETAVDILRRLDVPESVIEEVHHCILAHSFSLGVKPRSLEAMILSDADKLDAIGAVGVIRAFMESAYRGRSIEDTITHFKEKLLKLKDMMYTETAREMARRRHEFMMRFLKELMLELQEAGYSKALEVAEV